MDVLHQQYGKLLELVRKLIGVVPNCDPYMEIWPTSFRTYNVIVPNFLNLPFALWGASVPTDVLGLAMYVASRNAGCAYCSAHTTAFALRRGADPDKIARALKGEDAGYTPRERAAMKMAQALARVPVEMTDVDRNELRKHFPPEQVEWLVLGVAMMGFLNKFMDAVGVELEAETVGEVGSLLGPSGWSTGKHASAATAAAKDRPTPRPDTFLQKLSVIPLIPSALSKDRQWTAGVPDHWPAIGKYLQEHTGSDFKILAKLTHDRAIRAMGVVLRDNLDAGASVIGLPLKVQVGLVFATIAGNKALTNELRALGTRHDVSNEKMDAVVKFAGMRTRPSPTADPKQKAILHLARVAAPSPAVVDDATIDECRKAELSAASVVETITWISVLQMLHRLMGFYG
jgi:AhpD family alkylhydroperoxidase